MLSLTCGTKYLWVLLPIILSFGLTSLNYKEPHFSSVMLVKVMYLTTSIAVFYATNKIFEQGNFAMYGYDVLMSIPQVSSFVLFVCVLNYLQGKDLMGIEFLRKKALDVKLE